MPHYNIWIREVDNEKWLAIKNRSSWLHDHLDALNQEPGKPRFITPPAHKKAPEKLNKTTLIYQTTKSCKHGFPTTTCKYAIPGRPCK